jgi:O-antigen/teichoic acid export membrane protein
MRLKLKPIFKDTLLTLFTQVFLLACFFAIYKLVANQFGPEGVGEYSLIKKAIGLLIPLLFLGGLGNGLSRFIAINPNSQQHRSKYLKIALTAIVITTTVAILTIIIFKTNMAELLFGDKKYTNLIPPLLVLLAGLLTQGIITAYLRGRSLFKAFNLIQIFTLGIIPITILLISPGIKIEDFIMTSGILTLSISIMFLIPIINDLLTHTPKGETKNTSKTLLSYAIPRLPTDFILNGIFAIGPIIASSLIDIKNAGYIAIVQNLIMGISVITSPLGIILLPKVANLIAQDHQETIRTNINMFIKIIFQTSVFITIQLFIFGDVILKNWLGEEFKEATYVLQIASCAIPFYFFFLATRDILDAIKIKPINTINLVISFIISTTLLIGLTKTGILPSQIGITLSFTLGLICLGILSYFSIRKLYKKEHAPSNKTITFPILANIILAAISITIKTLLTTDISIVILLLLAEGIIYAAILWKLNPQLAKQIFTRLTPPNLDGSTNPT